MKTQIVPLSHAITIRGWTQAEFATLVGMRLASVVDIVTGKRWPQLRTRQAMARVLGVSGDVLLKMLEMSAELAAADELERSFGRNAGRLVRLGRRVRQATNATVRIAESTGGILTRFATKWRIRRRTKKFVIVIRRTAY